MEHSAPPLRRLIENFRRMPGIGRKSAQRLAFYVLSLTADEAKEFADSITEAHTKIRRCAVCGNLTEDELCGICDNITREQTAVCVVEDPQDLMAIEKTRQYKGLYHVLNGVISPLDGIGPDDLNIKDLISRLGDGSVEEVILATNSSVEGEATSMYLSRLIKPFGVKVTRLAYGLPIGSDLQYADEMTLSRAIEGRQEFNN